MAAPQVGILVTDGVTLTDITPVRERLEGLGIPVTVIVPTGGSMLPVSGRYYPAAGGCGVRRALCQVSSPDFDVLLLPDQLTGEQLARCPELLRLIRGQEHASGSSHPVPVFTIHALCALLDAGVSLHGLAQSREPELSAGRHLR